eukprot:m.107237 g.107237  ORF g.107237 m.107237 type:complete len:560 (-) comp15841_c0_seq1:156-1835(-)
MTVVVAAEQQPPWWPSPSSSQGLLAKAPCCTCRRQQLDTRRRPAAAGASAAQHTQTPRPTAPAQRPSQRPWRLVMAVWPLLPAMWLQALKSKSQRQVFFLRFFLFCFFCGCRGCCSCCGCRGCCSCCCCRPVAESPQFCHGSAHIIASSSNFGSTARLLFLPLSLGLDGLGWRTMARRSGDEWRLSGRTRCRFTAEARSTTAPRALTSRVRPPRRGLDMGTSTLLSCGGDQQHKRTRDQRAGRDGPCCCRRQGRRRRRRRDLLLCPARIFEHVVSHHGLQKDPPHLHPPHPPFRSAVVSRVAPWGRLSLGRPTLLVAATVLACLLGDCHAAPTTTAAPVAEKNDAIPPAAWIAIAIGAWAVLVVIVLALRHACCSASPDRTTVCTEFCATCNCAACFGSCSQDCESTAESFEACLPTGCQGPKPCTKRCYDGCADCCVMPEAQEPACDCQGCNSENGCCASDEPGCCQSDEPACTCCNAESREQCSESCQACCADLCALCSCPECQGCEDCCSCDCGGCCSCECESPQCDSFHCCCLEINLVQAAPGRTTGFDRPESAV